MEDKDMKTGTENTFNTKSKKLLVTTLMILLIAAAVTPIVLAQTVRYYAASISPTSVNAGATVSFTVTITNDLTTTANQKLKSATVQVPAGFTVGPLGTPTSPSGKPWTAALVSGVIKLSGATGNDGLISGESVAIAFSATAPTPAVTTDYEWTTVGYQSADWTDTPYTLKGSQPVVTVVVEVVPEEIVYEYETAYAYCPTVSNKFTDKGFSNWGWSNGLLADGTYDFQMWAGAGQCDLNKGTMVGTVQVVYGSGTVTVAFTLNAGITLEEYHVYAGSTMFPIGSSGKPTVAPGQYEVGTELSGEIYVIVHAVVGIPQ